MTNIIELIHAQLKVFTNRNNFTLSEVRKNSWNIFNLEHILMSIELSFHNTKVVVELTGYLSTDIHPAVIPNLINIINGDKIKRKIEDSNIDIIGNLLLNSRTLILQKSELDDIKYIVLFELCKFDYENKIVSEVVFNEYQKILVNNLN